MCGRYLLDIDIENLEIIYDIVNRGSIDADWRVANKPPREVSFQLEDGRPSPAVFPTNSVPVVLEDRIGLMPWGYHLQRIKGPILNCRIETLMEKPFYQEAVASRRLVVPASAYYEWQTLRAPKVPFTVYPLAGETLHLAGIYFKEVDANGRAKWRFALVTTPAYGPVATIHDRMPLLLDPEQLKLWRTRQQRMTPRDLEAYIDQSRQAEALGLYAGVALSLTTCLGA